MRAASKSDGAAPVFVDASEGEGAYRLMGRYHIQGTAVAMTVIMFRGSERIGQVTAQGTRDQPDGLARAAVAAVGKILKP